MGYKDSISEVPAVQTADEFKEQKEKILATYALNVERIKKEISDLEKNKADVLLSLDEARANYLSSNEDLKETINAEINKLKSTRDTLERQIPELNAQLNTLKDRCADIERSAIVNTTQANQDRSELDRGLKDLHDAREELKRRQQEYDQKVAVFEGQKVAWKQVADEQFAQILADNKELEIRAGEIKRLNESVRADLDAFEVKRKELKDLSDSLDAKAAQTIIAAEEKEAFERQKKELDEEKTRLKETGEHVKSESDRNAIERDALNRMRQDLDKRERAIKDGEAALAAKLK